MTHTPVWRKRGTGLPPKYGPAHTGDPNRMTGMGWYAYCGTWFPSGRDKLWTDAAPGDRKCPECERRDRQRTEREAPRQHPDAPRPNVY